MENDIMIKVIHIIGLVGAGKTHFINMHFPDIPEIFDIKTVYEQSQFEPGDLHNNPQAYEKFMQAMDSSFKYFVENMQNLGFKYVVCESTGTNAAMNQTLRSYKPYILWIEPDQYRMENTHLRERPYAESVNKAVMKKWHTGKIYENNIYDPRTDEFQNSIPESFRRFFRL
jgi:hypothetical protein